MSALLDSIDLQTRLAGTNRMELLLFRLDGEQVYAINVFKVQEVLHCPALTQVPQSHPVVRGIVNLRGRTFSVLDLAMAIGRPFDEQSEPKTLVVTEYNGSVQGFLVGDTDRIVNMNWEQILPPPPGLSGHAYLTAVTELDGGLVQILDVEKVLAEVMPRDDRVSDSVLAVVDAGAHDDLQVLVADDSAVARRQIESTLQSLGIGYTSVSNGRAALQQLQTWAEEPRPLAERLLMVISDVEMPDMDGYSLTRRVRNDPALNGLYVLLHTSMSGDFNRSMVEGVGADAFIPKFQPDTLAEAILQRVAEFRARAQTD